MIIAHILGKPLRGVRLRPVLVDVFLDLLPLLPPVFVVVAEERELLPPFLGVLPIIAKPGQQAG
ncbi:hypothetical protein [Desulfonatronum thioautotrophicum]|uniref:hypothetical protein n=1 Tax=Desulfonatronum thioautotrophicum TaxID=617001 RepID=UPI001379201C|nr:hypothetical protein [Desulfonatronum thioautotrophicum]